LAGIAVAGCDGRSSTEIPDRSDVEAQPREGADAYVAAIASRLGAPQATSDPLPVVYVVPLDEPIALETQAAIIERFDETHDVRFVDDLSAAVDIDEPGSPPRDDAVVLGVGTPLPEPPHLLRLEVYRMADQVEAALLTLAYQQEQWVVVTSEPVPAEVLIDAP
jgi:hypothetical protein